MRGGAQRWEGLSEWKGVVKEVHCERDALCRKVIVRGGA